ncbi:hypothetical protein E2C01_023228 [Portunus trituberculatus]|uniref:Uncharacterized protein n=1 Tax=Portunus trituberculatus TaxID=210409 RepID=A0A5B7EAK9_PORTR|nr:hypothetical protein [Portunus trituberculatus]
MPVLEGETCVLRCSKALVLLGPNADVTQLLFLWSPSKRYRGSSSMLVRTFDASGNLSLRGGPFLRPDHTKTDSPSSKITASQISTSHNNSKFYHRSATLTSAQQTPSSASGHVCLWWVLEQGELQVPPQQGL